MAPSEWEQRRGSDLVVVNGSPIRERHQMFNCSRKSGVVSIIRGACRSTEDETITRGVAPRDQYYEDLAHLLVSA